MGDLLVELYDTVVGRLSGGRRDFDFAAEPAAVRRFGLDSSVLSVAVPVAPVATRSRRAHRQAFFLNLLPEGQALARLADRAGVEADDAVGFLRHYGRDVAGALQVWDPEVPGEPRTPRRVSLDDAGVAALLRDAQGSPLGNRPVGGKTSLAGVQEKIVLAWDDGWGQVLDGYPSTHILKPLCPQQNDGVASAAATTVSAWESCEPSRDLTWSRCGERRSARRSAAVGPTPAYASRTLPSARACRRSISRRLSAAARTRRRRCSPRSRAPSISRCSNSRR